MILLKNGLIVTQDGERRIFRGDVLIDGDRIISVEKDIDEDADETIDCTGDIISPGLINTHGHVSMAIMRSSADDLHLHDFLERTFSMDAKRTRKDVYWGSMLGILEMIRSGTTSFVDLYYWEDEVAKAVKDTGIRGFLAWATLDEDFTTQEGSPLSNAEHFVRTHAGIDRVYPMVGIQGVYVASKETWLSAKEIALRHGTMTHFHLSETRKEVYEHQEKTGMRPAEWLDHIGFLGNESLAAHGVWLTVNEIRKLSKNGAKVSHNPTSNMKLATGGYAPLPEMFREGVTVSLGTDGCATNNNLDMMEEMKFAAIMHKAHRWDATVIPAQKALDMATTDGAKSLRMEHEIGSIEPGKKADIIVLDGNAPEAIPLTPETVLPNMVYSMKGDAVKHSIIDGNIVMRDRKVFFNEEAVKKNAQQLGGALISSSYE